MRLLDMPKVLVAMSGGVDSSVAAHLLKQQGYDCIGAMMKLFTNETIGADMDSGCCSLNDAEDARAVAFRLGIPFYVFNFTDCFAEKVLGRFAASYLRGHTPNPCIDCNRFLKFERFLLRARQIGCDAMATGHYARIVRQGERYLLQKSLDKTKDQSYVLYAMTQEQLSRTLLPLGGLSKDEVRARARAEGFVNAQKGDSQDICFAPDGDYAAFIERHTGTPLPSGHFVDTMGGDLGKHRGFGRYTVGQRRGLGISAPAPLYVCDLRAENHAVVVGGAEQLMSRTLTARDINLIACDRIDTAMRVRAKIRYRQPEQRAIAEQLGEDELRVTFDEPQRAITKGQAVVLYDGDLVIGGGTIAGR